MHATQMAIGGRQAQADGLRRMMVWSFGVHLAAVFALFAIPDEWLKREEPKKISMSLALGSPGQKTGGMTPAGGRPIEEVAPPPKRPTPILPAAPPQAPAIAAPAKSSAKLTPRPVETPLTTTAPPRPPTTGPQKVAGSAAAETGVVGQASGLSGGGQTGMAGLDTNFCCPEYGELLRQRLWVQWQRVQNQPEAGITIVSFVIRRDGSFGDIDILQSSSPMLEIATKSMFRELRFPPLPEKYKEETLTVKLRLDFKR